MKSNFTRTPKWPTLFLLCYGFSYGLTPIRCDFKIVNVFIEKYPTSEDSENKKVFFNYSNNNLFELNESDWDLDSTEQAYVAKITVNEKSAACHTSHKYYFYVSESCETIKYDGKQYKFPKIFIKGIHNVEKALILGKINLKACFS